MIRYHEQLTEMDRDILPTVREQSRDTKAMGISKPRKLKPRESQEGKDIVTSLSRSCRILEKTVAAADGALLRTERQSQGSIYLFSYASVSHFDFQFKGPAGGYKEDTLTSVLFSISFSNVKRNLPKTSKS